MLWFQDISFWNQSFQDHPNEKRYFIASCIKLVLNKLYTPKVIVQNVPKRIVKLPFLGRNSKETSKNLVINLRVII